MLLIRNGKLFTMEGEYYLDGAGHSHPGRQDCRRRAELVRRPGRKQSTRLANT